MSDPNYSDERFIRIRRTKKEEGKFKRFVVNPIKGLASWEIKPDKKKDRLTA